jgi:hypothetical protein
MLVDLTRDEIEMVLACIDSTRDSAIDTKRDLQGADLAEQEQYVEDLQGLLLKFEQTLLDPDRE